MLPLKIAAFKPVMQFKTLFPAAILLLSALSMQARSAPGAGGSALMQSGQATVYPTETEATDHTKGLPSDAKLLRDHLAEGESAPAGGRNVATRATGTPAATGTLANGPGGRDDGLGVANAVKDFVKPIQQEISNSSVVQAVREFDAGLGGRSATQAGITSVGYGRSTAGQSGRRTPDGMSTELMWEQFLDEVLPWLAGGAFLLLLGYGAVLWLKILKMKKRRVGHRRRQQRRSRSAHRTSL